MATPIVYDSGDSGAPQITIPAGAQVISTYQQIMNVIKTCLCSSAGSGATASSSITGGGVTNVTVSSGGSAYTVPPLVTFSGGGGTGATGTAVLGSGGTANQVVSVTINTAGSGYTSAPSVSFTPAAYGSKVSAGWTMAYDSSGDASNPRMAIRQPAGNQFYFRIEAGGLAGALGNALGTTTLQVVSAGTPAIGRRYLRVRGFETMSNVDTGTNMFPNLTQQPESASLSYYWCWAAGANSIASPASTITIPWTIVASDRFFYIRFFADFNTAGTDTCVATYFFGDLVSNLGTDAYHTVIHANSDLSTTTATAGTMTLPNSNTTAGTTQAQFKPFCSSGAQATPGTTPGTMFAVLSNLYVCRPYIQVGGPLNVGTHTDYYKCSDLWGLGNLDYPEKITGSLYVSKAFIHESTSGFLIRGTLPGLWIPNHSRPLSDLVTFAGTGPFAGINLLSLRNARGPNDLNSYNVLIQLSDWLAGP